MKHIKRYSIFESNLIDEDLVIESAINESIIYFSPRMRSKLSQMNNPISKKLLNIEGTDVSNVDVTFIDVDGDDVTFITMPNAMKLIKQRHPDANNSDLDISGNKRIADIIFTNDMNSLGNGRLGDTGVYVRSRNTIKIGKLINRIFKGALSPSEVENFVNSFKSIMDVNQYDINMSCPRI